MAVKNRLKEILDEQGRKQTWLADKVGVHKATISNVVKNRYATTLDLAFKISIVLGKEISEVFYYEEE